ncbi:long-chain-fatty-acid--CoA ligase ACSBG2 [Aplysia californica]|uniref:long-chain-fatty-acid--CoA ligase n=1 Tax=Aplysia californica TaxID=6500 RepID=A0ABM1VXQ5_APLCA|nr:long-chain-fatty-acid--CoA ligase ACSBG2 [Aplysia californica]XP_005090446.1 long-chain-fatty-acid--CoA ligase ACSBG2 [Aplysia californica]XP_035827198.1 long-chain-fatty-acid--CoA ligase ACSBG2 [Aplysia californica]
MFKAQKSPVSAQAPRAQLDLPGSLRKVDSSASIWSGSTGSRVSIDEQVPAVSHFVHQLENAVNIRVEDDEEPVTVPSFLLRAVQLYNERRALAYKYDGKWEEWTYGQYYQEVVHAAESFIMLGLNPHESVGIACSNSPMYFISALAAVFAGGIFVGITCTNVKNILLHMLRECKVNIMVVDSHKNINQILDIWSDLPSLKAIVNADVCANLYHTNPRIYLWRDFLKLGLELPSAKLSHRLNMLAPNRCCAVFYPFVNHDTTFLPNGVMVSHDNLTYMAQLLVRKFISEYPDLDTLNEFRLMSYLSLNSPFALILEMLVPISLGGLVSFADQNALKGTLALTLREVKPHVFCGTVFVWALLQKRLFKRIRQMSCFRGQLLLLARNKSLQSFYRRLVKSEGSSMFRPGKFVSYVTNKVKRKLGLSCCKLFLSYDGSLKVETLEFFISLGIPIIELFTSTLLSGPHSMGGYCQYQMGSVGKELNGFTSKFTEKKGKNRKMYAKGRHVCMGILHQVNLHVMDHEGYVYTGISAYKGRHDFLYTCSDLKEVLILDNGCTVAYPPIENLFKDTLPIVSHCMLVGHMRSFAAILLTLKSEVCPTTYKPTKILARSVQIWLRQRGTNATTVSEIIQKKSTSVYEAIEDAIISVNKNLKHQSAWILKWRVLPIEFSLLDGELDPITMELRRDIISKKYKDVIDGIYSS